MARENGYRGRRVPGAGECRVMLCWARSCEELHHAFERSLMATGDHPMERRAYSLLVAPMLQRPLAREVH